MNPAFAHVVCALFDSIPTRLMTLQVGSGVAVGRGVGRGVTTGCTFGFEVGRGVGVRVRLGTGAVVAAGVCGTGDGRPTEGGATT